MEITNCLVFCMMLIASESKKTFIPNTWQAYWSETVYSVLKI